MPLTQFVRNYNDDSTESGFRFEFFCDRCGSGYQSEFSASSAGTLTDVLDAAGGLLGGIVGTIASLGEQARSAAWEKAHDDAFKKAVGEARPYFHQCRQCGSWVDKICWNAQRSICKDCVPDSEEDAEESPKPKKAKAQHCTECGSSVAGAKFCPECGKPVKQSVQCPECDTETQGAKFCPECGTPQ